MNVLLFYDLCLFDGYCGCVVGLCFVMFGCVDEVVLVVVEECE